MSEPPLHPLERPPAPRKPQSPQRSGVRPPTGRPILAPVLLGLIVAVFLVQRANEPEFTIRFMKDNQAIRQSGEYYRLLTMMFLHGNADHLFFNGLALYVIGMRVERLFGPVRFGLIYFLGGLAGSLASLVFTEGDAVGASGAIFALIGAELIFFYTHQEIFGQVARQRLNYILFISVMELVLGFVRTYIDNAAHIGGLAGGAILAWFIAPRFIPQLDVADEATPHPTVKLIDANPLQKTWHAALLYAGALALGLFLIITL